MTIRRSTPLWFALAAAPIALALAMGHPLFRRYPLPILASIATDVAEYFAYAVGFFGVFWLGFARVLPRLSRRRWPRQAQVVREIAFSLSTHFVFLAVGLWITFDQDFESPMMYKSIDEYGWAWYAFTIFLVFFAHDTYFYWTHRLMHQRWVFDRLHRLHHESVDPTPFTTYAFHPAEAIFEALGGLSLLPILGLFHWHESIPAVWGVGQILFNSIGHLGFEIYPSRWLRWPLLRWKTPAMHHYLHHQRVGGNFGLYFRFWDRLCGTEFPDFETRYERLFLDHGRRRTAAFPLLTRPQNAHEPSTAPAQTGGKSPLMDRRTGDQ